MTIDIKAEVGAIQRIEAVPKILDVTGRMTGMGFVAIARVTSEQWVCCAVRDNINFGLAEGGELQVETTICNEIRQHGKTVVVNDVETDGAFCDHPTPAMYGFRSYISAPIILSDGTIWGTLCAIDPKPRDLGKPEILGSFQLLSELIASQLELNQRLEQSQADLKISQTDLLITQALTSWTKEGHPSFANSSSVFLDTIFATRLHQSTPACVSCSGIPAAKKHRS
jgi:GAF domain-containing protein